MINKLMKTPNNGGYNMNHNDSLAVALENARMQTIMATNQIRMQNKLPAFLYEGIICDLLAEIRQQKAQEIINTFGKPDENPDDKKEAEA